MPPELLPTQSARTGEDFAAVQVLRGVVGQYELLSDCKGTVGAIQHLERTKGPTSLYAHLWSQVGDAGEGATARHIPAHTAASAVERGLITALEREGNIRADALAKQGAALQAADDNQVLILEGFHSRAWEAAR